MPLAHTPLNFHSGLALMQQHAIELMGFNPRFLEEENRPRFSSHGSRETCSTSVSATD